MQAAGETVSAALPLVELAPRVQAGEDQFDNGCFFLGMHAKGNATAIVFHADRGIGMQGDLDFFAVSGQGFIGRVVQHFLDDVQRVVGPGVHAGPLFDGLESL